MLNYWNAAQNHKLLKMCPRNNPNKMPSVYGRETDLNSITSALGLKILVKTPSDTLHRRLRFQVYSFLAYVRSIYYLDK